MGELLYEDLTWEIIGAAFTVHSILGPGFLESIYEEALAHELSVRNIAFKRQVRLPIMYKSVVVGEHILDLLIDNKVVVELKAVTELADVHRAITWSYLTATKLQVGLLLNFGQPSMVFKRVIRQQRTA